MATYNTISDEDLLHCLKNDDTQAFTEIYKRYQTLLYIYAYKKIENKMEARDLVQDILLNLWSKRKNIHINSSLKSYLYTSTRNKVLDIIAHSKIENKYIESLQNIINQQACTDHSIREKELQELINKEIQGMPPRMKEIFLLSRSEWLTNAQIAKNLSISQSTVETQIKRALKLLRMRLARFMTLISISAVHIINFLHFF